MRIKKKQKLNQIAVDNQDAAFLRVMDDGPQRPLEKPRAKKTSGKIEKTKPTNLKPVSAEEPPKSAEEILAEKAAKCSCLLSSGRKPTSFLQEEINLMTDFRDQIDIALGNLGVFTSMSKALIKPNTELPKNREKYKDRTDRSESAIEFLDRVWGDLIREQRLYQFNLRPADTPLLRAVNREAKNAGKALVDYISTKKDYIDRELVAYKDLNEQKIKAIARQGGAKAAKHELIRLLVNKNRRVHK